jgi:hypothetical protein
MFNKFVAIFLLRPNMSFPLLIYSMKQMRQDNS